MNIKTKAIDYFRTLLAAIDSNVVRTIYKVTIAKETGQENSFVQARENRPPAGTQAPQSSNKSISRPNPAESGTGTHFAPNAKIGRNDSCWCGSGKKYKRCHGA